MNLRLICIVLQTKQMTQMEIEFELSSVTNATKITSRLFSKDLSSYHIVILLHLLHDF